MYIRELVWDDYRIDHIARHDVEPFEVEDVCDSVLTVTFRQGKNRYRVYGQTAEGRYLFIVLERLNNSRFKPITARDMTPSEKSKIRRLK